MDPWFCPCPSTFRSIADCEPIQYITQGVLFHEIPEGTVQIAKMTFPCAALGNQTISTHQAIGAGTKLVASSTTVMHLFVLPGLGSKEVPIKRHQAVKIRSEKKHIDCAKLEAHRDIESILHFDTPRLQAHHLMHQK